MMFQIRNANQHDLEQLLELEKIWPEASRATERDLSLRIEAFAAGYFVVEDDAGIYASFIAHPYHYNPNDLSNFKSWNHVNTSCFLKQTMPDDGNALYIISATNKKPKPGWKLLRRCMEHVLKLAYAMNKNYILAGVLLPGYAKFLKKHGAIDPEEYAFKQINGRFVDPLIEKLRHVGFYVPTKQHVIAHYFPDAASLNYSALVVKSL